MKKLGFLLITVAFLGGSLVSVSVVDAKDLNWFYFGIAFAMGVLGVLLRGGNRFLVRAFGKLFGSL